MTGSVEPLEIYIIVPRARASHSYVLRPWGEQRCLIDEILPARAVLRELGPLLEGSRYACPREGLVQRMPERELWTPMWSWPTNPGSEKLPWHPILCHGEPLIGWSRYSARYTAGIVPI